MRISIFATNAEGVMCRQFSRMTNCESNTCDLKDPRIGWYLFSTNADMFTFVNFNFGAGPAHTKQLLTKNGTRVKRENI